MKPMIKTIGIDDGAFSRSDKKTILVGAIVRGNDYLEGIICSQIRVDGLDSTEKIKAMVNKSRHRKQLRAILIQGSTLGGFNLVDIKKLNKGTKIPVITVVRKKPNKRKVLNALKNFKDKEKRIMIIRNCGEVYKSGKVYFQVAGITKQKAILLIKRTTKMGNIPEPIRLAHLIASAVSRGESHGRA